MCSTNQLVRGPAAGAGETACIPRCSCFSLTNNERLEIVVPSFAAFVEDRERKAEGRESFLGAEAACPCFMHAPVYSRERDDSAAVSEGFVGMKLR